MSRLKPIIRSYISEQVKKYDQLLNDDIRILEDSATYSKKFSYFSNQLKDRARYFTDIHFIKLENGDSVSKDDYKFLLYKNKIYAKSFSMVTNKNKRELNAHVKEIAPILEEIEKHFKDIDPAPVIR